jgi:hypothetical protein
MYIDEQITKLFGQGREWKAPSFNHCNDKAARLNVPLSSLLELFLLTERKLMFYVSVDDYLYGPFNSRHEANVFIREYGNMFYGKSLIVIDVRKAIRVDIE